MLGIHKICIIATAGKGNHARRVTLFGYLTLKLFMWQRRIVNGTLKYIPGTFWKKRDPGLQARVASYVQKLEQFITKAGQQKERLLDEDVAKVYEIETGMHKANIAQDCLVTVRLAKQECAAEEAALGKKLAARSEELHQAYLKREQELLQVLVDVEQIHGYPMYAWDNPAWEKFQPSLDLKPSPLLRFATTDHQGETEAIFLPVSLPIIGKQDLLLQATGGMKDSVISAFQNLMLRLLVALPPSRLRFLMIDPVGVGANFSSFMHLPEEAVSGKIWTDSRHIEEQLQKLSDQMETIIQKYLRSEYQSMEAYNKEAGEVAEPYRLLVVADFPVNFTEHAAQKLLSIAKNGPRTGIYTLVHVDPAQKLPYNFSLADLQASCAVVQEAGEKNAVHYFSL